MTDRPILFSAPMVRALLDGTKSQTRRVLKQQPTAECKSFLRVFKDAPFFESRDAQGGPMYAFRSKHGLSPYPNIKYNIGDRLWVKETWRASSAHDDLKPSLIPANDTVEYVADGDWKRVNGKTRVSIFMPRWASRLTLTVTDVRVERLQDISEDDAEAEGILLVGSLMRAHGWKDYSKASQGNIRRYFGDPRESYRTLWNSINGAGAWDANPWVVAVSFAVGHGNIDA